VTVLLMSVGHAGSVLAVVPAVMQRNTKPVAWMVVAARTSPTTCAVVAVQVAKLMAQTPAQTLR
jgi:hypothetical protein